MEKIAGLSLTDRKLIIGIDFGTTFSGVAWAETRRPEHHSVIEIWPSGLGTHEGMSSPKVPTELRYTAQGTEWGLQIPAIVERHQWFKLGLADGRTAVGSQKTPEELTSDYLTALCDHLMYTLEQKLGASIIRTIPLEFCLTVPAIWSEVAKEKTLKACQKAGLKSNSDILLVSEPEAAAIYALHGLDPHGLQVGESFVLCDAGGGTVDLISYTITELYPMLKVREAAPGTGGLCGSTFLNRRFGEFLTKKLGKEPGWDEEILAEAMERFDSVIKKQYSPSTANEDGYSVLVPGLANNPQLGIRRGRFSIKAAEMKEIFEPIMEKVVKLVQGQIKATNKEIRAVLLVGGFGQNNHLKECLRSALGPTVEVLQPPNAWTAVVRGAVMMGLANANASLASVRMESRAARKHYGLQLNVRFKLSEHDDTKKYWCARDRYHKVKALHWFIRKGDPVDENKPYVLTFDSFHPMKNAKLDTVEMKVYCDKHSLTAPIHKDGNVRDLVTLKADLSHVSKEELDKMETKLCNDGERYYRVKGAVEATFQSASTKYVLICQDKRYDTVTAEYV